MLISFSKYSTNNSFNVVPLKSLKLVRKIKHKSKSCENSNKVFVPIVEPE